MAAEEESPAAEVQASRHASRPASPPDTSSLTVVMPPPKPMAPSYVVFPWAMASPAAPSPSELYDEDADEVLFHLSPSAPPAESEQAPAAAHGQGDDLRAKVAAAFAALSATAPPPYAASPLRLPCPRLPPLVVANVLPPNPSNTNPPHPQPPPTSACVSWPTTTSPSPWPARRIPLPRPHGRSTHHSPPSHRTTWPHPSPSSSSPNCPSASRGPRCM